MNSNSSYETDVVAWAQEQAELIRAGRFDQLDLVHIADEIEDVGKSEQRELARRMSILLMHMLQWEFQSSHRNNSLTSAIRGRRRSIARRLKKRRACKSVWQNRIGWKMSGWMPETKQPKKRVLNLTSSQKFVRGIWKIYYRTRSRESHLHSSLSFYRVPDPQLRFSSK